MWKTLETKAEEKAVEAFGDMVAEEVPLWDQQRSATDVPLHNLETWFYEQEPMAVLAGSIQLRHSVTFEVTQLKGIVKFANITCPGCKKKERRTVLMTSKYWIVRCTGCQLIWWIHRKSHTNALLDAAIEAQQPFFSKPVTNDRQKAYWKREMEKAGHLLVQEVKGDAQTTYLVFERHAITRGYSELKYKEGRRN